MKKTATCLMLLAVLNTTACGYFLFPERVGQTAGRLDPTIVILDAAGLLVGVIPGVVAFAVDITTGAIYLPAGEKSSVEKHAERANLTNDVDYKPVDNNELAIDTKTTADRLSATLGYRVNADDIVYYQPESIADTLQWQSLE